MLKKLIIKSRISMTIMVLAGFLLFPALAPVTVGAQVSVDDKNAACEGLSGGNCDGTAAQGAITGILKSVIEILSWIVGIISVIMIIVGGFKYVVSSGDPNGAKSAKNTVVYALVGIVVAALAQVLVRFVLSEV